MQHEGLRLVMSVNAITSVSLYEYYYQINQDSKKKKSSPIEKEMREYGLNPTDDEHLNIAMLQRAKQLQNAQNNSDEKKESSYSERPWADLMYQLNLSFNPDPKDDIEDIKEELAKLAKGVSDDELDAEIRDLGKYVENLYLKYQNNTQNTVDFSGALSNQLNNMSMLNKINIT